MTSISFFQQILDKAESLTQGLLTATEQEDFAKKKAAFETELSHSQYLKVPIVGVFSAGKSSFLNVFTGKNGMLPVDTMPETAVAYELYYDTNERVELFTDGQRKDQVPLADIAKLPTQPGDVAKVYCDSEVVKRLQERNIVLVDMPGIGSGIEQHEAAISHYIQAGTAFILLVDVEQGSLRTSTLTFLDELKLFRQYPAVFLTKTDKKSPEELKAVCEYVSYQLSRQSDVAPTVGSVCAANNDVKAFAQHIDKLDPDAMLRSKLGASLRSLIEGLKRALATRVDIRQQDIANVDERIKEIETEVQKAKQSPITTAPNADTPQKSTQDVLDNVERALRNKVPDLAQMLVKGEDSNSVQSAIVSVVRAEILRSLEEEGEQYMAALGESVQQSLQGIGAIQVGGDFLSKFSDTMDVISQLAMLVPVGGIVGRALAFIIANSGLIKNVLNWLFGTSIDLNAEREAQQKLLSMIPDILEKIRPTILQLVSDNQQRIQQSVQQECINRMNQTLAGLNEKKADQEKSKEKVKEEITALQVATTQLDELVASI